MKTSRNKSKVEVKKKKSFHEKKSNSKCQIIQRTQELKLEISHRVWHFGGFQWTKNCEGKMAGLETTFQRIDLVWATWQNECRFLFW